MTFCGGRRDAPVNTIPITNYNAEPGRPQHWLVIHRVRAAASVATERTRMNAKPATREEDWQPEIETDRGRLFPTTLRPLRQRHPRLQDQETANHGPPRRARHVKPDHRRKRWSEALLRRNSQADRMARPDRSCWITDDNLWRPTRRAGRHYTKNVPGLGLGLGPAETVLQCVFVPIASIWRRW
jgi:hypothetical protein